MRFVRHLLAAVLVVFASVAIVQPHVATAASVQLIDGSGSSWAVLAVNQWTGDAQQQGLQVVFTPTGSVQGRQDFAEGATDFAVSDMGYQGVDPQTGSQDTSSRPYAYLPLVAGGMAFPYNLVVGGQKVTNLRLSGETLAKIFTDQITNWDAPEITADNNGVALPSIPIIPVVHSEETATSSLFSQWLASQYPSLWKAFSGSSSPIEYWPTGQGDQVAEDSSDNVMSFIDSAAGQGSIGFDEYTYALFAGSPVAAIENPAGDFTTPTPDNVAVSLTQAQIDTDPSSPDYRQADYSQMWTSTDPRSYPFSYYSYMIIPTSPTDPTMDTAKRQVLADFIDSSVCEGQSELGSLGYAPLPYNLVRGALQQVELLAEADPKVVLGQNTTAGCADPTFLPDDPSADYLGAAAPMPPACAKTGQGPCPTNSPTSTSTAVAGPSEAVAGQPVTLTATVTEADAPATSGQAGTVDFYDDAGLVATASTGDDGVYNASAALPPSGTEDVTAVFTPANSAYAASRSGVVRVSVAPSSCANGACSAAGNLRVTVAAGTLTISTPYTQDNPFVLPPLALSPDGTYLESSASLSAPNCAPIVVTSTLAGDPGWTVSVAATDLVDASGATISSSGLGFTDGQLTDGGTFPGTVAFTDIPPHNPSPVDTDSNPGLGSVPQSWATTPAGDGTATITGTLTLLAPTSTPAGLYTGTISLSAV